LTFGAVVGVAWKTVDCFGVGGVIGTRMSGGKGF
jgi:hypothetical protein